MIHVIAAVAENGVIGADGRIPWNIPEDLQHFRELTRGHTVIMGRRTYESIGHALPGRKNIIVSQTLQQVEGCLVVPSLAEALQASRDGEVFIIGGQRLYTEALPLADVLDLTLVQGHPAGDVFFPAFDARNYTYTEEERHDGYVFVTLVPKSRSGISHENMLY